MTDPVCTLGEISLPVDIEWVDRDVWSPVSQQVEITLGGALILEESAQLAGRPITLRTGQSGSSVHGPITRAVLDELQALAYAARTEPLALVLPTGHEFDVYFNHSQGAAVDARPLRYTYPDDAGDYYALTLRLITAEL